jgi:hypothetical protein
MKRHNFDALSFVGGLIFVMLAAAATWDEAFDLDIGAWVLPVAVLVLGVGLMASAIRSTK